MHSFATLLLAGVAGAGLTACGDSSPGDPRARRTGAREATTPSRVIPPPASPTPRAPDAYRAAFVTSKGTFVVEVTRAFAPRAADRFHELVTIGYYDGTRFYRIVPGFVAQWGIHGDTAVSASWRSATMPDEPSKTANTRGTVAFAANGPDSRAVEVFVATGDSRRTLDRQRFAPFGRVGEGMEVVDRLNAEYGEEPNYSRIVRQGNRYLSRWFPTLDSVVSASIVPPPAR